MTHSEHISWTVAILLSLLLHSIMLMQTGSSMGMENITSMQHPLITRLNFSQSAVKPIMDVAPAFEKKLSVEKKIIEKSRSLLKKNTVPKPEPVNIEPLSQPVIERQIPLQQLANPLQGRQVSHSEEALLQE